MSGSGLADVCYDADLRNSLAGKGVEVTVAEAAQLTGYSDRHIRRLARNGFGRRVGGAWAVDRDALAAYVAAQHERTRDDDDRAA
jgi:excisionase family DNA binding protein